MPVTIKDVAKAAGVSISTVSKVINGNPRISQPTTIRVKRIMGDLDYHPNSIARSFVRQNSSTIGLIIELSRGDGFANPYLYEIIGGIEQVAQNNGYLLTITNIKQNDKPFHFLKKLILEKRVDGFLLHVPTAGKKLISELEKMEVPFVIIGQPPFPTTASWVDVNNVMAGQIAAKHLLELGRKRIAFMGGPGDDQISARRLTGMREILGAYDLDLPDRFIQIGDCTQENGYSMTRELLRTSELPDSILCSSSYMAHGVMECLKDHNINIPESIAVVSFDNYPLSQYLKPQLTVVDIDVFELGVEAGRTILQKISNPHLNIQYNMLSPRLLIRASSVKGR